MSSMNRLLVLAAILISACAGAVVSQIVIPPAHAAVAQRWEHLCFTGGTGLAYAMEGTNKKLNEAGKEGWELVSAANGAGALYCMKRPAP